MFSTINCFRTHRTFFLSWILLAVLFYLVPSVFAQGLWKGYLLPQNVANSRGLERHWIANMDYNPYSPAAEHLNAILYDRGAVFAVTDQGTIQSFEGETGKTKWITYTKTKGRIVQGLSASKYYVAFTAGSTLYVLNRENGRILSDVHVPAIPTNDLVLGETGVYVPTINGQIYAYDLMPMEDPFQAFGVSESVLSDKERKARKQEFINSFRLVEQKKEPLGIRSMGELKVSPQTTRCMGVDTNDSNEYICWPTGSKLITMVNVNYSKVKGKESRISTNVTCEDVFNIPVMGEVICPVSYKPYNTEKPGNTGIVYAGTTEGFVYALRETNGDVLWRFPTGEMIRDTPVYADGELFVVTALSGMYCLDAEKGGDGKSAEAKWWSPNIHKFVACSKHRVYALDAGKMLLILDRASGQQITSLPLMDYKFIFTNNQNDRIYFATESGIIQCLREVTLETPLDFAAEYVSARETSVIAERRAARLEEKAKAQKKGKKTDDRMGDGEDGGWGEDENNAEGGDDDGGFDLGEGDDDENADEDADAESDDEMDSDDEDSGNEDSDDEDSGDEDSGDEDSNKAASDDDESDDDE